MEEGVERVGSDSHSRGICGCTVLFFSCVGVGEWVGGVWCVLSQARSWLFLGTSVVFSCNDDYSLTLPCSRGFSSVRIVAVFLGEVGSVSPVFMVACCSHELESTHRSSVFF